MFCGKCGTRNDDNADFCCNCGARLDKPVTAGAPFAGAPMSGAPMAGAPRVTVPGAAAAAGPNGKNRNIGIIAVAGAAVVVVVILIVVLAVTVFGGRSDKETVNKFCDAVLAGDARGILDLVPDKVMDYAMEEHGYDQDDLDDMIDDMEDSLQVSLGALDLFGGSITYEITGMETLTGVDLQDVKDDYADVNMKISAAKTAEVTLYIESALVKTDSTMSVGLIKVGNSWYLDVMNMDSVF